MSRHGRGGRIRISRKRFLVTQTPLPPTVMHHMFELDEILRLITVHLAEISPKGALSLACCCKSFSTPVLDTMWGEEQKDLTTLLKTFPRSVWEVKAKIFVSPPHQLPIDCDLKSPPCSTFSATLRKKNGNGSLFTPEECVYWSSLGPSECSHLKWP